MMSETFHLEVRSIANGALRFLSADFNTRHSSKIVLARYLAIPCWDPT